MLVAEPPYAMEPERERAMGELKRLTWLAHEARVAALRKLPGIGPMAEDVARAVASRPVDAVMAMAQTLDLATIGALAGKANLTVRCGIGLDGRRTEGVTWDGGEGRPLTARLEADVNRKKKRKNTKRPFSSALITVKDAGGVAGSALANVAAVGAASALQSDPLTSLLFAGVLAFVPPLFATVAEAMATRKKRNAQLAFQTIVDEWARDDNVTPEEIAGRLEANKDDPSTQQVIWQTVKTLLDEENEAATVPLGVLAQQYLREKRKPDSFFRGAARLIQELQAEEMQQLRSLLAWATSSVDYQSITVTVRTPPDGTFMPCVLRDPAGQESPDNIISTRITESPGRLFHLMELNGLSTAAGYGRIGGTMTETSFSRETAVRLARILRTA